MARLEPGPNPPVRDPPHSIDAERAVLGAMLLEGSSGVDKVIGRLRPEDFYLVSSRLVYHHMVRVHEAGRSVDLLTVSDALSEAGELEEAGGPAMLALLVEHAAILVHLDEYVAIVLRDSGRRQAIEALTQGIGDAFESGTPENVIHELTQKLERIATRVIEMPAYDPAVNWRRIVGHWRSGGIKTGYDALDRLNGGLWPGDFIVVGGRTATGKTSFMTDLSLRLATMGVPVDVITLEESGDSMTRRAVSNLTGISTLRLKDGGVSQNEFSRAEAAIAKLQDLPWNVLSLETLDSLDESRVVGALTASVAHVVIVDHLQQITTRDQSRVYALERVMKLFHSVTLKKNTVVMIAAQLGRGMDARDGVPRLSDLRDSGRIEEEARQVWLLSWTCKYQPDTDPSEYEIYLAKQCDGPTGVVPLRFEPWCGRFQNR